MGAGVPAVPGGGVVDDLAVGRGPGFAQQPRGLGQGQPLGDGGLEVDPVVVPQSLSLFHSFFVLSLRWAAGKDMIAKNLEKKKKRARAAGLLQSLSQVTAKKSALLFLARAFCQK